MAPTTFSYDFSNEASGFRKKTSFSTGLFINGQSVDSVDSKTFECDIICHHGILHTDHHDLSLRIINPTTAKSLGHITVASEKDIDLAVEAAQKAFDSTWGLHTTGQERGKLLIRLAELIEENIEELAALESLDNGERIFSTDPESFCLPSRSSLPGKAVAIAQAIDVQGAADVLRCFIDDDASLCESHLIRGQLDTTEGGLTRFMEKPSKVCGFMSN
jgi:Aldehyde dehydrogenase family